MSSALTVRRYAVVVAPLIAAMLIVAGFFLDPAIGESGRELAEEYAAHPGREQVSALAFHFGFALLAIPAVALIVAVRGRGAWLANLAGFLGVLGLTTLPGFLLTDFYDIAIYGELGGDAWDAVDERIGVTLAAGQRLVADGERRPVARADEQLGRPRLDVTRRGSRRCRYRVPSALSQTAGTPSRR